MLEANQWGDLERISEEFTPITLKTEENTYWKDYEYGWPIQKLRPWIEVDWSTWWLYAAMQASSSMSIPNNTDTTIVNLLTKFWDTTMTATDNQITITQSWNYLLSAYCYIWWSTWIWQLRIIKNWISLVPYYVSTMTASWTTPYINIIEYLVSWDVLTLLFYQNSWTTRTLINSRLSVLKI